MKNNDKVLLERDLAKLLTKRFNVSINDICLLSEFNDDLGLDSLDKIEYLMQIEQRYNIIISDEDASDLKMFGELVIYIYNMLNDEN